MEMVIALFNQTQSQLALWTAMLAVANMTTKILAVLCVILVLLLVLIARSFVGSKNKNTLAEAPTLELRDDQKAGQADRRAEPVIGVSAHESAEQDIAKQADDGAVRAMAETLEDAGPANPSDAHTSSLPAETIGEDFKIFKRTASASQPASNPKLRTEIDEDNELAIIEKNMVRLKELFHEGHITRDVYVDETRTLYHQAKSLVSSG